MVTILGCQPRTRPKHWVLGETKARNGFSALKKGGEGVDNPQSCVGWVSVRCWFGVSWKSVGVGRQLGVGWESVGGRSVVIGGSVGVFIPKPAPEPHNWGNKHQKWIQHPQNMGIRCETTPSGVRWVAVRFGWVGVFGPPSRPQPIPTDPTDA